MEISIYFPAADKHNAVNGDYNFPGIGNFGGNYRNNGNRQAVGRSGDIGANMRLYCSHGSDIQPPMLCDMLFQNKWKDHTTCWHQNLMPCPPYNATLFPYQMGRGMVDFWSCSLGARNPLHRIFSVFFCQLGLYSGHLYLPFHGDI